MGPTRTTDDLPSVRIERYGPEHRGGCGALFDSNAEPFFAPHERDLLQEFLDGPLAAQFFVATMDGGVVGCGGIESVGAGRWKLRWGMVRRDLHGRHVGERLLVHRIDTIRRIEPSARVVLLETTRHSAGFYERFGFTVASVTAGGFADGLDTVEMVRSLDPER